MAKTKSYHESGHTFVPAAPQQRELPIIHVSSPSLVDVLPPAAHTAHARSDDDAMTMARATLVVSAAYIVASAMITGGLLLIAYLFRALGDAWGAYVYGGLIIWGLCVLASLYGNRRQGLHHSASGVSHHEIESRERLARHAIDVHANLLLRRWEIDRHDR